MKIIVLFLIFLTILVFLSGCMSTSVVQETAQGELHAHYVHDEGWSPGLGCYERVTGYVYNAGTVPADAVRLNFNLVNSGTGTIRDSRSIFIGSVGKGETRTYETVLDGECTQDYRVDLAFEK